MNNTLELKKLYDEVRLIYSNTCYVLELHKCIDDAPLIEYPKILLEFANDVACYIYPFFAECIAMQR